ncbi:hypothetical protein [Dictyobacter aurantiacus]|uniref:HAMP domain-containing protein n=1 Tax=Dictyobacter aurantiacus TaxID=1936993 RepID=A0A401ZGJ4_9CHLR|nr:hypothetical protein [Dictyobacter aurantiacus]GCE05923.1 hypothetical protein KDAU_32520 [Dictyobacter aurantiacus]
MRRSPLNPLPVEDDISNEVAELIELDPRIHERDGIFKFWYHLTAPPMQPLTASFELREAARMGRLTSTVLAITAGSLIILAIPTSLILHAPALFIVLCVLLTIISFALFLNRIGKGFTGRLMVVIAMNISLAISILTWPGGLTTNTLPVFDIMVVEPTLVALALLPPASVFIIALVNTAFIGLVFYKMPYAPDLMQTMKVDGYEVVTRPLYLLLFVIGVIYPVMRNVLRALALGDRAKEIAKVQRFMANREAAMAREKQQLDADIQKIVNSVSKIANGSIQTQISLPAAQSLWPIAGALNTLYARIRGARQSEQELQHTRNAAANLVNAIHRSKQNRMPLQLERSGNPIIDEIILELTVNQSSTHPLLEQEGKGPERNQFVQG